MCACVCWGLTFWGRCRSKGTKRGDVRDLKEELREAVLWTLRDWCGAQAASIKAPRQRQAC